MKFIVPLIYGIARCNCIYFLLVTFASLVSKDNYFRSQSGIRKNEKNSLMHKVVFALRYKLLALMVKRILHLRPEEVHSTSKCVLLI